MITSMQNAVVKETLALRESKDRRARGLTLVDGVREMERALKAGVRFQQVLFCAKFFNNRNEQALLRQFTSLKIKTLEVSDKIFARLSFGERAEGLLGVIETPKADLSQLKLKSHPLIVILESVEKPGNLGAILRSCDGAGVDAVLVADPKTDIFNPNVIRASTGIVFSLPVIALSTAAIQTFLNDHQMRVVAATPQASITYTHVDYRKSTAIVLGCEDKGLSEAWLTPATQAVNIPMRGVADSLNVSVSAALLVYEALRQRQKPSNR